MKEEIILGIDIGGTKIRGIAFNAKNKNVADFEIKTPKKKKDFLVALRKEIIGISSHHKIIGIGVGLPGIVDIKKGKLIKAQNLPDLNGWQAVSFFAKFCKNIKIDNDSRCFLLAEAKLGVGKKYKDIVGISIGTGIGGSIMIDGKNHYGANFNAGEVGCMIIDGGKTLEFLGAKNAFLKYGDRSKIIGIGVANLINILNPQAVILGGGGIASGGVDIDIVKEIAKKYIMSPLAKKTTIVKAQLGKDAQAIGASLLL